MTKKCVDNNRVGDKVAATHLPFDVAAPGAGTVVPITLCKAAPHFGALFCPAGAGWLARRTGHTETAPMRKQWFNPKNNNAPVDDFFVPELCQP
ncbi:MAG TPA: hypothetical protein VN156_17985, partial [Pseudomonas sp.]|nr:hypothetical protein [Pseudomonas sp.]